MEKDIIQEAENIAKTVGIPSQPQILVGINKEMSKSTPEFSRLLNLVSKDLGITAKLIKVANSEIQPKLEDLRKAYPGLDTDEEEEYE